jgi:hypothetical protein
LEIPDAVFIPVGLQGGLTDMDQFHGFFPENPFILLYLARGFYLDDDLIDQFVKGGFFEANNLHKR